MLSRNSQCSLSTVKASLSRCNSLSVLQSSPYGVEYLWHATVVIQRPLKKIQTPQSSPSNPLRTSTRSVVVFSFVSR